MSCFPQRHVGQPHNTRDDGDDADADQAAVDAGPNGSTNDGVSGTAIPSLDGNVSSSSSSKEESSRDDSSSSSEPSSPRVVEILDDSDQEEAEPATDRLAVGSIVGGGQPIQAQGPSSTGGFTVSNSYDDDDYIDSDEDRLVIELVCQTFLPTTILEYP